MMTMIRQILDRKGHEVWSVSPEMTVFDALTLMSEKNVGAVVVVQGGELIGMFSERDYARKIILLGRHSRDVPVKDIMTGPVITIRPDQTAEESMALMTEKRIRHLPVIEEGKLVGMVSIGDIVRAVISTQEFTIEQLENYISSAN